MQNSTSPSSAAGAAGHTSEPETQNETELMEEKQRAASPEDYPGQRQIDAPSTAHEYANGDRGQKSGVNAEQLREVSGVPGEAGPSTDIPSGSPAPAKPSRTIGGYQRA